MSPNKRPEPTDLMKVNFQRAARLSRSPVMREGEKLARFWLGAAIAPFTAALLYEAGILLDPSSGKVFTNQELLNGFVVALLPASYVLCLGLGAPLVLLLRRRNMLNCPILVGSAGALGMLMVGLVLSVSFIVSGTPWEHFDTQSFFHFVVGAGVFVAFVAGVFCIVAGITWRSIGRAEAAQSQPR